MKDSKKNPKRIYDTCSITMELERPLLEAELKNMQEQTNNKKTINSYKIKTIMKYILIATIIGIFIFFMYANKTYKPQVLAHSALISDNYVEVTKDKFITFTPKVNKATKGLILYPGAKVDIESYAPLAKDIAKKGYEVVIVNATLNLPILSPNKAKEVINEHKDIKTWIVGGHSLGGTAAAKFASKNKDLVSGVIFLASYPSNNELLSSNMEVLSIWGSKDGVLNFRKLLEAKQKLPSDTTYVEIEGGNHAQFGDYGKQNGDNDAVINQEKQLQITSKSIIEFLNTIK